MAADPFIVTSGDLATPALVAIAALVLFLVLLAFQSKKAPKPVHHEVADLGNHGEKEINSTVYVEENGHLVRRSTRARKPTSTTDTPVKAEETPKAKGPSTRSKTPSRTPARETTPLAADTRDEPVSPPRTRSRRTPRA